MGYRTITARYVAKWGITQMCLCETNQRAENAGLDPSWLDLSFLGRPDFQSRGPKMLISKGFLGPLDRKLEGH